MKKLLYASLILFSGAFMSSCGGHEEYETYISTLKAQPAVIDTISTPESYANYLDSLAAKAIEFESLGIKLDPTQQDEISTLSIEIQEALTKTYNKLAQTPMPLPEVLDASFPVDSVAPGVIKVE